jgi:hypothetical protein
MHSCLAGIVNFLAKTVNKQTSTSATIFDIQALDLTSCSHKNEGDYLTTDLFMAKRLVAVRSCRTDLSGIDIPIFAAPIPVSKFYKPSEKSCKN